MPRRAPHVCPGSGCTRTTTDRLCTVCTHKVLLKDRVERGSSEQRGYNSTWRRARLSFLVREPLCRVHNARGTVVPATVVDHIVPHRGDTELFWDQENWQSLCKTCHDAKTGRGE